MAFHLLRKFAMISALVAGAIAVAGASDDRTIMKSVKAMEREFGVTIAPPFGNLTLDPPTVESSSGYYISSQLAISPDGTAIAWWGLPQPYHGEKIPFVTLRSSSEGNQQVFVVGKIPAGSLGVSSKAEVIVAIARPYPLQGDRWELLAIDRHAGVTIHDLTSFVTKFEVGSNVEEISVSGQGTLAALGSRKPDQMQVLEIPSGKTVYAGPGRFPRLSPDGKRLAFVDKGKLWVHSFTDRSTVQLPVKRVKGIGGWSPDGRFLIAGAWTRPMWLAWEKREVIVDTKSGKYAVIDQLGEGNYGNYFAWISVKLLTR